MLHNQSQTQTKSSIFGPPRGKTFQPRKKSYPTVPIFPTLINELGLCQECPFEMRPFSRQSSGSKPFCSAPQLSECMPNGDKLKERTMFVPVALPEPSRELSLTRAPEGSPGSLITADVSIM